MPRCTIIVGSGQMHQPSRHTEPPTQIRESVQAPPGGEVTGSLSKCSFFRNCQWLELVIIERKQLVFGSSGQAFGSHAIGQRW